MPCLSIQFNPKVGPLVQVFVWKPGFIPAPGSPTNPINANAYMGLIDTGASCSCVSARVIHAEELVASGKQPVSGLHGSHPTNSYRFQLVIPFIQSQHAGGSALANVISYNIHGVEFIPGPTFEVLIGRDIICSGAFSMSFDGHATLSL